MINCYFDLICDEVNIKTFEYRIGLTEKGFLAAIYTRSSRSWIYTLGGNETAIIPSDNVIESLLYTHGNSSPK